MKQVLTKETIQKVAQLSRLKMSESEILDLTEQLSAILEHFKDIAQVQTSGVEPLVTPTDISENLRADQVEKNFSTSEILLNAPERSGDLFKVPPVV